MEEKHMDIHLTFNGETVEDGLVCEASGNFDAAETLDAMAWLFSNSILAFAEHTDMDVERLFGTGVMIATQYILDGMADAEHLDYDDLAADYH